MNENGDQVDQSGSKYICSIVGTLSDPDPPKNTFTRPKWLDRLQNLLSGPVAAHTQLLLLRPRKLTRQESLQLVERRGLLDAEEIVLR